MFLLRLFLNSRFNKFNCLLGREDRREMSGVEVFDEFGGGLKAAWSQGMEMFDNIKC
jgi:hypothetical protein